MKTHFSKDYIRKTCDNAVIDIFTNSYSYGEPVYKEIDLSTADCFDDMWYGLYCMFENNWDLTLQDDGTLKDILEDGVDFSQFEKQILEEGEEYIQKTLEKIAERVYEDRYLCYY